jgi:hypothetical protein
VDRSGDTVFAREVPHAESGGRPIHSVNWRFIPQNMGCIFAVEENVNMEDITLDINLTRSHGSELFSNFV